MKSINALKTATLITLTMASTDFTQKEVKAQVDNDLSGLYSSSSFSYITSESKTKSTEQKNYTLPSYYKLGYFLKGGMYVGTIFQHQIGETDKGYSSSSA